MTAQIHDHVRFNKECYSLVGVAGGPLVTPEQFGVESEMCCTACHRGFYVTYDLTDSGFYLRDLTISRWERDYVHIDGVWPESKSEDDYPTYRNLNIPVPFTGQLRLATGFIEYLYVHMGFQNPTSFRTVYDLTLENGKMVKLENRSKDMAWKRVWGFMCRPFRFLIRMIQKNDGISKSFTLDMDKA